MHEETGLTVAVEAPCLVNEFHDPDRGFHQVEVFFRCALADAILPEAWRDPESIVHTRRFFTRDEVNALRLRPASLPDIAWGKGFTYDPLERLWR